MTPMRPLPGISLSIFFLLSLVVSRQIVATMNVIDECWRRDNDWAANRQQLALCSVGFAGKMRRNRGRELTWYQVTDARDDPVHPRQGTLRHGATLIPGKVWITFQKDMNISLQKPLIISNLTTIDGRGANVQITRGAGFIIDHASSVIIHGLQFHHIHVTPPGLVTGTKGQIVNLVKAADGDAIRVVSSEKVWIDHNTLYEGHDGLIDATRGSTGITISNNWFKDHDKVMLLGHDDDFTGDRNMKVTVAFNRFGPNCVQRMPRVRHGYAHVVNNFYIGWKEYAMGGSMHPIIKSEGNLFDAAGSNSKAVIWKEDGAGNEESWKLKSVNDAFINGAFFGHAAKPELSVNPNYRPRQQFVVKNPNEVPSLTRDAGALHCKFKRC